MTIDTDTLREILADTECMVAFYDREGGEKAAQNAAMEAAGLKPMHGAFGVNRAIEMAAKHRKHAEALRYVITYHEGGIFAPAQTEEAA